MSKMEYYPAVKNKSLTPFKNLDERAHLKRVHNALFHLYDIFKKTKLYDKE